MFIAHSVVSRRACFSACRLLPAIILLAGATALAACSTTEGFGKDVKGLGGNIEDSAAKNK